MRRFPFPHELREKIMSHEIVERKVALLGALIAIVISVGGLVEIVPLYSQQSVVQPSPGIKPYPALALEGRDVYVREGCYNCHSQMVRPLAAETERYGHYSLAGEAVYDHPFQFGSKRTGPDLARVGGRYTDEWHRIHLIKPRDVVPESNMPGFPWLERAKLDGTVTRRKLEALQTLGVPYSAAEIAAAPSDVEGRTEMDALIAYLQLLKFHGAERASVGAAP
jgi:cytochrome c oxidase cbb3-type subunit II